MSSIKSFALTFVILAVIFGQISFITPIPMPAPPATVPLMDNYGPPMSNPTLNDQQQPQFQQQQQQQQQEPNVNFLRTLFKDRYYQTQEAARQTYVRELIERLQSLEGLERSFNPNPYGYDFDNDLSDYYFNNTAKRSWDKMNGMWGKRQSGGDWNKFRGSWGKREQSWNNLKGLWG